MAMSGEARRNILAGAIGNVLEWYDFAIYGYFAAEIGRTFFAPADPVSQMLSAFGVFAIGVLVRPLGGAVLGYVGDKVGRRAALICSVAMMAIPTFLIGLLPGYAVIGVAAPIALMVLRMIQGLSAGGEYTTSVVFMVEHAPPGQRGLIGAIACCSGTLGILAGSATGAALTMAMSSEALNDWGWRIPFLAGLFVGAAGVLLRRGLHEEMAAKASQHSPLAEALRDHGRLAAHIAALAMFHAVSYYVVFIYVVNWLKLNHGISPARALQINTVSMVVVVVMIPVMGWLADRVGRRPVMLTAAAVGLVAAWPLFWLMSGGSAGLILLGQLGFALIIAAFSGTLPSLLVEVAPLKVRCTVISLGFNVTLGVVGGLSPLVAGWLVQQTGNVYCPAFMIMAAVPISVLALLRVKESYRDVLRTA
jgi:MHS family proline/betaine transporter-like MFS transporter